MYFYQIKCCFQYSKRLHEQKNITTINSVTNTWSIQQTPMFHGCTITNKQNVEPWKLSTSWGHTKVLFTCCLHLNYWNCFANPLFYYVIYHFLFMQPFWVLKTAFNLVKIQLLFRIIPLIHWSVMFCRPSFNRFWGLKYIPRLFSEYMLTFRVEEPMKICVTN
jgi:hypothetical protein